MKNVLLKQLLLAIVIALLAWIFFFNGGVFLEQQTVQLFGTAPGAQRTAPTPAAISAFAQAYGSQMLSYSDPQYGFAFQYPVGYYAVFEPEQGIRVRFAAFVPGSSAEFLDFIVLNGTDAQTEFEKAVGDYSSDELLRTRSLLAGSQNVSVIEGVLDNPLTGGKLFLTQAFFDCMTPAPESAGYALVFNAVIPQEFASDKDLVDYMASTVKC